MYRSSVLKIVLCFILIITSGCTPASSSKLLPESDHPYANDFEYTWIIKEPGASQMRLHFEDFEFAISEGFDLSADKLILLDKYGNELKTYDNYLGINKQDLWTDWYTGDTLKVKLVTDSSGTDYGFKIDKIETRTDASTSNKSLPESDHPYANNFKHAWTIKGRDATQIRFHFEYIQFAKEADFRRGFDKLILLDKYDNELATYGSYFGISKQDFWTDWYEGDTLKVEFVTDSSRTDYGFIIDDVETKLDGKNIDIDNEIIEPTDTQLPSDDTKIKETTVLKKPISEEQSSTEQNSLIGNIIDLVSQNPLISTIIGGIILLFIEILIKGEL